METNHVIDLSDRLYKIILAVIGVVAVFLAGQAIYQFRSLPQNTPREINISGEGKALAKPDIAMVSFGVTAQAPKSQDAVNQGNQKMNAVIKVIKDLGIEDKDIKTTYYNLNPVYGNDPRPLPMTSDMMYPYPGPSNKIVAYALEQQVQVKIRDFDKINTVLDKAAASGANMVGNLQFTVDDMEQVRQEAREKAIAQAKEKAKVLSRQAGLGIGKLINVTEGYNNYPQPMYAQGVAEKDASSSSVAPQVQAGEMEVSTSVTLTYQLR